MFEAGGPTQGLKMPLSYPEREIMATNISLSLFHLPLLENNKYQIKLNQKFVTHNVFKDKTLVPNPEDDP